MEEPLRSIGERLNAYLLAKGLSGNAVGRMSGTSGTQVSNIIKGKTYGFDKLMKVLSVLPELNTEWLIHGHGEMIKPGGTQEEPAKDKVKGKVKGEVSAFFQNKKYISEPVKPLTVDDAVFSAQKPQLEIRTHPLLVTVDQYDRENIVLVDVRAAAGYVQHYAEEQFIKKLPSFSLPTGDFKNATFRSFQIQGSSMQPTFQPNDWVICSYVDNWPQNIKNGYVYVVVTPSGLLIKRVVNRVLERGHISLQSDNEEYETQEIDALDVLELWYVRARISFNFSNNRFQATHRISELEADVDYLMKQFQSLQLAGRINRPKKQG